MLDRECWVLSWTLWHGQEHQRHRPQLLKFCNGYSLAADPVSLSSDNTIQINNCCHALHSGADTWFPLSGWTFTTFCTPGEFDGGLKSSKRTNAVRDVYAGVSIDTLWT